MPRNTMNDQHWTDFLKVLQTVPAGHHASSNVLRDLLSAADIPEKSRGGLFAQAVKQGYLRPVGNRYEASEGETAHRAPVRCYRRTKQLLEVAA